MVLGSTASKQRGRRIPAVPKSKETNTLEFSFKRLDTEYEKFKIGACSAEYFCSLIVAIQKYFSYSIDRFRDQNKQQDRHTIYFGETSESEGFISLDENLRLEEAWQFKTCPDEVKNPECSWRASGILNGNTFYLIWLDPEHKLYPDHHPSHTAGKIQKKKK